MSKLALVFSGVRAVCAFSPNPNMCLSALALSGLHTQRPLRSRVDACSVPGLGRPWRARGPAREGILPWAHSISTARLSWAGGFSEARGEASEVGMSRGSGGKGGSGRVCLLWALRSDPLLQGRHWGSGWGHWSCADEGQCPGLASPSYRAARCSGEVGDTGPPASPGWGPPGRQFGAPLSPVAGGSRWWHPGPNALPGLGCRWAGFTSWGRGRKSWGLM